MLKYIIVLSFQFFIREGHLLNNKQNGSSFFFTKKALLLENTDDIITLSILTNSQFADQYQIMAKRAIWNGKILAESLKTIVVENNHYFPPDSIKKDFFQPSNTHTTCGWKGVASYYSIVVDGKENKDAAWYYPNTKEAANNIKGYIAFWKGVKVE
jgi:uncharacterized protein (DUF427 family)